MKPIYTYKNIRYYVEQDIIDAGVEVVYWYCLTTKGRWGEIEHMMIDTAQDGYMYAKYIIDGPYNPDLEAEYLLKHRCGGTLWVKWYIEELSTETA